MSDLRPAAAAVERVEHARVEPGRAVAGGDQHLAGTLRVEGDPDGIAFAAADCNPLPRRGVVFAQLPAVLTVVSAESYFLPDRANRRLAGFFPVSFPEAFE